LVKYIASHEREPQAELLIKLARHQTGEALSYQLWCQYLAELSRYANNPKLGIELGELAEAEHGGILAYLVSSCETLGDALIHFTRYQSLLYGDDAQVESVAENILIRWSPNIKSSLGTQISDEVLIVGLVCFIKRLVGPLNELPKIGFIHDKPSYSAAYEEHLGDRLSFGGRVLTVEFPVRYLALEIHNPEPVLKDILEQQAEVLLQQENSSNSDFSIKVRVELKHCINESRMTLESLSLKMHMSSRTLHRRLQALGINFNQLLKDIRLEMALEYLDEGKLSLTDISELLGYTEQSAFSRAFKQWTEQAPKQYLKTQNKK
jgi:AraC-like DNA-binding protein